MGKITDVKVLETNSSSFIIKGFYERNVNVVSYVKGLFGFRKKKTTTEKQGKWYWYMGNERKEGSSLYNFWDKWTTRYKDSTKFSNKVSALDHIDEWIMQIPGHTRGAEIEESEAKVVWKSKKEAPLELSDDEFKIIDRIIKLEAHDMAQGEVLVEVNKLLDQLETKQVV